MNKKVMFSHTTDIWSTPQDLYDRYNEKYHFDIDVCALPKNAKCKKYFTPEMDGLSQEWRGRCWCNPPYGRQIGKWVKKAFESKAIVVMLLPARTDTKWFHEYCLPYGKIEFIKGRIKFGNAEHSAPFPSMIVVFGDGTIDVGYTGAIGVTLFNNSNDFYTANKGDKIAQLVVTPIVIPMLEEVDELDETERGTNGFGSSGYR